VNPRGASDFYGLSGAVTRTPVAELVTAYLEDISIRKTSNSARVDSWYVRRIFGLDGKVLPRINSHFLEDITTSEIHDFLLRTKRDRRLSAKSGNRYREILIRFFNWAVRYRDVRMPFNPAARIERFRESRRNIRFLTLSDIQQQLDSLAHVPYWRAAVSVFIFAGLRRAELLWLTPDDVDMSAGKNGVIHVQAKEVGGTSWEPKTKKDRSVPVNTRLKPILAEYILSADSRRKWFFPSPTGCRWDQDSFSERLRNLNREHHLRWNCQDYRHTFGSQLAMRGESLYKISDLMGNSPEVCRRHYACLNLESLYDAVEFPS